jgi:hypothetical protein
MDIEYVFLVAWIFEGKYEFKIFKFKEDAFKLINKHKDIQFNIYEIQERFDVSKLIKEVI